MPFLHIIMLIKNSLQKQVHFNGNIFENECCRCNDGSLYKMCESDLVMPSATPPPPPAQNSQCEACCQLPFAN